jgi:MFS family permease
MAINDAKKFMIPVLYAGYFIGQYPCGWLVGHYPAQKMMAINIFLWGVMVILMTQARTYSSARMLSFLITRTISQFSKCTQLTLRQFSHHKMLVTLALIHSLLGYQNSKSLLHSYYGAV